MGNNIMLDKEKGGYDVEFVDNEPNDVTCCICLFVLREPMQAEQCGHRFCKSCIDGMKESENECITCPQDRIINKIFRDRGKEREILNYLVKCTNSSNGCQWTGELRDLEKHLVNCEYQLMSCENEGCGEEIERRNLSQHADTECTFRNVNCQYCKVEMKFHEVEEHGKVCDDKPIECTRCNEEILQYLMKQHLQEDCTMIVCEYSDIGCQQTVSRDSMSLHKEDSMEAHLNHAIVKLREQEKLVQEQRMELIRQSETIGKQNEQLEEQQVTITGLQLQMREFMISMNELQGKVDSNSDRLAQLQPAEVFQNEVIWVINDFKEELEGIKGRRFTQKYMVNTYSRTFITKKGYKCKADLYLNGQSEGKSTHVSVYVGVEEGPFDNILMWPMDATVSFCVLKNGMEENIDWFSTVSSREIREVFKRPMNSSFSNWGFARFIPHYSIFNLVTNNTLTLKMSVK